MKKPRGKTSKGAHLKTKLTPSIEVLEAEEFPLEKPAKTPDEPSVIEFGDDLEILPPEETLPMEESTAVDADGAADSKDIVQYDPLSAYLREIARFPVLSRDEERELAFRYYNNKDIQAAYTLISSNLWLVVKIAREYQSAARHLLDLIQEGNIGLMEAIKNFDPFRDVRFPSYATWWVKAYIIRYIIANLRLVKIGTTQAQRKLFFNLRKEKEKLEREGFFPAPKLLADKLDVKESEVIEMEQRLGGADLSVDAPLSEDSESDMLSVLASGGLTAEDLVAQKELRQQILSSLDEFASGLNDKEKLIFNERLLSEEKATLQDLSEKLSVSRERVRQIETRLRDKLKSYLEEKFGSSLEQRDFEL